MNFDDYDEIWALDFEFHAPPGCNPMPICMVAKELRSGRILRLAEDALRRAAEAPFNVGSTSLTVAYFASAEISCFKALGWPMPANVVDLYVEFRNLTNGRQPTNGWGLLGALMWFGLPPGDACEKKEMRDLAIRGGPFNSAEMSALLDYCESDVEALARLWPVMVNYIPVHSLIRGRYMKAVAQMESVGIPLDTPTLARLDERWDDLKDHLKNQVDPHGLIWVNGSFSQKAFGDWLVSRRILWPRDEVGRLILDDGMFSDMAKIHPVVQPILQVRRTLSKLKLSGLSVGSDGRNRALLSPFRSLSGRNQPSTSRFIFGNASWLRHLIKPEPGMALAYIDWSQQEFGVGAILSGDLAMREAYVSSDPYLAFAKMAGAVPADATKASHSQKRNAFKTVVLGVGYGMSAFGLAAKLGISLIEAEELLLLHRRCYPAFWKWSQGASDHGQMEGRLETRFGWQLLVTPETKDRTLRNFPSQANGAEMMRLAAIYATERGIRVCAPVHDAFLIEAPKSEIHHAAELMRGCMARASADVLDGFQLDSDSEVVLSPSRFGGEKPNDMWDLAMEFLN